MTDEQCAAIEGGAIPQPGMKTAAGGGGCRLNRSVGSEGNEVSRERETVCGMGSASDQEALGPKNIRLKEGMERGEGGWARGEPHSRTVSREEHQKQCRGSRMRGWRERRGEWDVIKSCDKHKRQRRIAG